MVQFIEHSCPQCSYSALAPMSAIVEGDAGIWQCERCNRAYRIEIEFHLISEQELQRVAEGFPPAEPWQDVISLERVVEERSEQVAARLAEVVAEISRLREAIRQLEDEAHRLEHE
jgi:hypothetical protein